MILNLLLSIRLCGLFVFKGSPCCFNVFDFWLVPHLQVHWSMGRGSCWLLGEHQTGHGWLHRLAGTTRESLPYPGMEWTCILVWIRHLEMLAQWAQRLKFSVEMGRLWSEVDGKGGVYRIELPRLSLSFTRSDDGRFFCDQLAGHWNLRQKVLQRLLQTYWSGLDTDVDVYTLAYIE